MIKGVGFDRAREQVMPRRDRYVGDVDERALLRAWSGFAQATERCGERICHCP